MSVDGSWSVTVKTPMGAQEAKFTFSLVDKTLTGSMEFLGNASDVFDGTFEGGAIAWKAKITSPMPATVEFSGNVDGDKMSGTASMKPFGPAKFEGTKVEG